MSSWAPLFSSYLANTVRSVEVLMSGSSILGSQECYGLHCTQDSKVHSTFGLLVIVFDTFAPSYSTPLLCCTEHHLHSLAAGSVSVPPITWAAPTLPTKINTTNQAFQFCSFTSCHPEALNSILPMIVFAHFKTDVRDTILSYQNLVYPQTPNEEVYTYWQSTKIQVSNNFCFICMVFLFSL
jgi:hypothetical protein